MRQLKTLILTGAALLIPVAAQTLLKAPACTLQVIPDYVNPIAFKAVLRLSPACAPGTVLRVRKSSTLNTKARGAKYQPIKPLTGAWEVGNSYTRPLKPVPDRELWTTQVPGKWRWEWWDASRYNTITKTSGSWVAGEVIRAAP